MVLAVVVPVFAAVVQVVWVPVVCISRIGSMKYLQAWWELSEHGRSPGKLGCDRSHQYC